MSVRVPHSLRPLERAARAPHALIARLRSVGEELRPLAGDLEAHVLLDGGALGALAKELNASDPLEDALTRLALVPPKAIEQSRRRSANGASPIESTRAVRPVREDVDSSPGAREQRAERFGAGAPRRGASGSAGTHLRPEPRARVVKAASTEAPLERDAAIESAPRGASAKTLADPPAFAERTTSRTTPVSHTDATSPRVVPTALESTDRRVASLASVAVDARDRAAHDAASLVKTTESARIIDRIRVHTRTIARDVAARMLRARAAQAGLAVAGLERALARSPESRVAIDPTLDHASVSVSGGARASDTAATKSERLVSRRAAVRSESVASPRVTNHAATPSPESYRRVVEHVLAGGAPNESALLAALGVTAGAQTSSTRGASARDASPLERALEGVEATVQRAEQIRAGGSTRASSDATRGRVTPERDLSTSLIPSGSGVSGLRRLALRVGAPIQRADTSDEFRPTGETRESPRVPETSVSAARAFASASTPLAASATPATLLSDDDALAERLAAILAREARRHGIDPGEDA